MKKIKILLFISVILSTVFALSVSIPKAGIHPTRPTIKIGGLGPLAITPGNDMKKALEMAVEEINSGNGVNVGGTIYDFELIIETSSGSLGIPDPATGVTAANKLILNDNVTAIIGGFRTEVVLGIQMSYNLLDRPFLGIGVSAPIVSPHFWRVGPVNVTGLYRNIVDLYAYGLVPDMGVRNITIIRESASWTLAIGLGIKDYFKAMGPGGYGVQPLVNFTDDIVLPVTYTQNDVTTALAGLKAATFDNLKVNALMTILTGPVGRHVPVAWHAHDLPQLLAGLNVESQVSTYFDETEGACYGEIELETCPPDVEPNANTAPFRTKYNSLYNKMPTYTAFSSYDAVYLLKTAIEDADSLAYDDIEASLANIEYEGSAYTIKFTSEPGPHWTVTESSSEPGTVYSVPILTSATYPEGVPIGTFDVHDLYTNGTYGVDGRPHNIGYWVQWQPGGVKKTIWHNPEDDPRGYNDMATPRDNQRNLTKGNILWPIDHNEHGWGPEPTTSAAVSEACENNDPEITITGIEDDSTYSGSVIIGVSATDESDIVKTTIQIKYGVIDKTYDIDLVLAAGTWTGSYDLDTTGFPDETYDVTIRVYDACGNVETIILDITFDNDIAQSTGTETEETYTSEQPTLETPGFELLAVLFILGNLALLVKRQKRKKG